MSLSARETNAVVQQKPEEEPTIIQLQVGEKRFLTTHATLVNAGFFNSLLSGRWESNMQSDGSYFIDADPNLFEHILRYLRRGLLPLFYDNCNGHDHALYTALLQEARYFLIPKLITWLEKKGYLGAVTTSYASKESCDLTEWSSTNGEDIECHYISIKERVYICPRGIFVHMGQEDRCGKDCQKKQPPDGPQYEERDVTKTILVRKETVIKEEALLDGWDDK